MTDIVAALETSKEYIARSSRYHAEILDDYIEEAKANKELGDLEPVKRAFLLAQAAHNWFSNDFDGSSPGLKLWLKTFFEAARENTQPRDVRVGDRVRIVGPAQYADGGRVYNLEVGDVVTVVSEKDGEGDVFVKTDAGRREFIAAGSVELIATEDKPATFKVGDRVKITGEVRVHNGMGAYYHKTGDVVTVVNPDSTASGYGYGSIRVEGNGNIAQWIDAASLTLVTEPRVWNDPDDIPFDVTLIRDRDGDTWERYGDEHDAVFPNDWPSSDTYSPFTEVIK